VIPSIQPRIYTDQRVITVLKMILLLFVLYRVFSLDIYAALPNDATRYVKEAVTNTYFIDPLQIVQLRGFKFPGYPIYLSIWHNIAPFLPIDGLTLMALSQRLLLGISLIWLFLNMGFFSIPLVLLFSSNIFLAQSNILYTEGMSIPMAILFAISLVNIYRLRNKDNILSSYKFWLLFLLMTVSFVFLILTKLTHAAFTLPLLTLAFNIKHQGLKPKVSRTKVAWPVIALISVISIYILAVSFDNKKQFGKFTPIMGHERVLYFGLWNDVFYIHPENIDKPELAEFYDNGSPYGFLHRVDKECGGKYQFMCSSASQDKRTDELLERVGYSLTAARIRTALTGIIGGQKSELNPWRDNIVQSNGQPFNLMIWHSNWYTDKYGMKQYLDSYNRGEIPTIIRGLSGSKKNIWRVGIYVVRLMQALMTVIAIITLGWFMIRSKTGLNSVYLYSAVSYLVYIIALSSGLVDLWRYIIPCWSMFIIVLFYGIQEFMMLLQRRKVKEIGNYI